ncbi:MAG TPA: hypothetical protein VK401_00850 [Propionibacteriaceae bacterium]|jgi:hypothetical protein|nr:hypothetical protein [Propionibacteriaceae bacterium]
MCSNLQQVQEARRRAAGRTAVPLAGNNVNVRVSRIGCLLSIVISVLLSIALTVILNLVL